MGMLLKCLGLWLLILWRKDNLLVLGNDDSPLRISLPTINLHDPKPVSTEVSAGTSSQNDTHILLKEIAPTRSPVFSAADVMKRGGSSERLDSREGYGGVSENVLKLYHQSFPNIDHGNRPSGTNPRKGVVYEPENVEKNITFPGEKRACCFNNTLGIRNGSDDNCKKYYDTVQSGKNTSDSASNETYATEEVSVLPANQTYESNSLKNGSSSVKQDGHNSSLLDNKSPSTTPLSTYTKSLDATNGSNLLSQSPILGQDSNATVYAISVLIVTLTALVVVIFAALLYNKYPKFWKWTHLRCCQYNEQVYSLLDDLYGI
jgi:hypothetical protein